MIELYTWGTANGLRASVALAETGLEHRIHKVDPTKGEHRRPEYLKLNPSGQIPVYAMSDAAPTSGAIFQLENTAPEKSPAIADFFKNRLAAFFRNVRARAG